MGSPGQSPTPNERLYQPLQGSAGASNAPVDSSAALTRPRSNTPGSVPGRGTTAQQQHPPQPLLPVSTGSLLPPGEGSGARHDWARAPQFTLEEDEETPAVLSAAPHVNYSAAIGQPHSGHTPSPPPPALPTSTAPAAASSRLHHDPYRNLADISLFNSNPWSASPDPPSSPPTAHNGGDANPFTYNEGASSYQPPQPHQIGTNHHGAWSISPKEAAGARGVPSPAGEDVGTAARHIDGGGGSTGVFGSGNGRDRRDSNRMGISAWGGDPDRGSGSGSGSQGPGGREVRLLQWELELSSREAELEEMRRQNRPKNWPMCCPLLRHSISEDVPPWHRRLARSSYLTWLVSALGFVLNACAVLAIVIAGSTGVASFFLSLLALALGLPLSFLLWHRNLYAALQTDGSTPRYITALAFLLLHLAWAVFATAGPPKTGAFTAGLGAVLRVLRHGHHGSARRAAATLGVLSSLLWLSIAISCCVLLGRAAAAWRAGDSPRRAYRVRHAMPLQTI